MLVMLLGNPRVLKVGRLVNSDLRQLQDSIKREQPFPGAVDLGKYAKDRCTVTSAKCSLADLCATVLETRLNKNVSERTCTAWERRKVTDEQIRYAACDAYAPLLIYEKLSKLSTPKKLSEPLVPSTPLLLFNADSTNIIARGRLASPDVRPSLFEDIKLSNSHVLAEILEVYVPGAVISSHKNRALDTFGITPFFLVCLRSRLRSYDPVTTKLPTVAMDIEFPATNLAPESDETASDSFNGPEAFDKEQLSEIDDISTISSILHQLDRLEDTVVDRSEKTAPGQRFEIDKESNEEGISVLASLRSKPWPTTIRSRIIKDLFHIFNMLQLSTTHALRKEFAFVLRDALLDAFP